VRARGPVAGQSSIFGTSAGQIHRRGPVAGQIVEETAPPPSRVRIQVRLHRRLDRGRGITPVEDEPPRVQVLQPLRGGGKTRRCQVQSGDTGGHDEHEPFRGREAGSPAARRTAGSSCPGYHTEVKSGSSISREDDSGSRPILAAAHPDAEWEPSRPAKFVRVLIMICIDLAESPEHRRPPADRRRDRGRPPRQAGRCRFVVSCRRFSSMGTAGQVGPCSAPGWTRPGTGTEGC